MSSAAYAKYEDSTLRKVLGVCLDASQANAGGNPPVLFLGALAEVRARRRSLPASEGMETWKLQLQPSCVKQPSPLFQSHNVRRARLAWTQPSL